VRRAAHKLAGAVSNFHARRTVQAARRLEEMARAGNLQDARAALAELEDALAVLHPALDDLVRQTRQGAAAGVESQGFGADNGR
jgi:HPt (histidine-containing phosphotransfer) domain-containing protein